MWTTLWILWGLMFSIIEAVAVANDSKDDTLSEHFRRWFKTDTKKGRTAWLLASGVFFAWFTTHIAVEGSI